VDKERDNHEGKDETGFSEKDLDLDIEIGAGEWQNLRRFNTFRARSRQGKIIATHKAVSNRLRQLEKLFYELARNNPKKSEKMLIEIKKLRLIQEVLLQCLVWTREDSLEKDMVPLEVWELIK
jgi:hypothetical protein